MTSRQLAALLLVTLIAGCGSPSPTYRSLSDFSELDLSSHSLVTLETLPNAPKGFTDSDVSTLAVPLMEMAKIGTYDPDIWDPGSQRAAIDRVLHDLAPATRRQVNQDAREQLDGRPWASLVGIVLADDVEIVGEPMMQRATWDVSVDQEGEEPWLDVRLQTKSLFTVRHHTRQSVVVVTHTLQSLSPTPAGDYYPALGFSVDTAGADPCAFVLRSVITPDGNNNRYIKDMQAILEESPTKFVKSTDDHGDATAKACRDKKS